MACKAEAKKVRLECPLCLDNFKDATLLNCGHTFCKRCLEGYGEQRNNIDRLTCPVCRKSTKLGPNRVKGLTPNFAVKVVEDKINEDVDGHKASYCSLHSTVYKDIFCLECGIFICLTCYFDTHKDHKIIKKEEMGRNLRDRRDALIENSRARITEFEKCLNVAAQEDEDMHRHLNNMKKDIKDTFARKLEILQKNEELLLKRVDGIQKESDEQSKRYMDHHRQLIDNINSGMTLLRDKASESSDSNTLQAYHVQCREIENFLKQTTDNESMVHLKEAAKTMLFCPVDEKLLALGHIELGVQATTSGMQRAETAPCVGQNVEELQASSKVAEIPTSITPTLKIVRKFKLPSQMTGMAALSQDAVVIGYGDNRDGADCFYVSGKKKPHLRSKVGHVYDITVLTDGRSVVSQNHDALQVFDKRGEQIKGMRYMYPVMDDGVFSPQLCHDQHDNIYAVDSTSDLTDVFIFHGKNTKPKRVVPTTGDFGPEQIHVTKTGVMIITCFGTSNTVNVFDREGHVGTTITANYDDEYVCAAVDSQDRVLVARVREESDTIGLTRYTLQRLTLTEEVTFNPLKLHETCIENWCNMISLTPNMIAFSCEQTRRLYFIEIAA